MFMVILWSAGAVKPNSGGTWERLYWWVQHRPFIVNVFHTFIYIVNMVLVAEDLQDDNSHVSFGQHFY